jgi:hypothetical protein
MTAFSHAVSAPVKAIAPNLHLGGFRLHHMLLALDEMHHLPSLAELDPQAPDNEASWSRTILLPLNTTQLRLLFSGTLKQSSSFVASIGKGCAAAPGDIDADAPGWAISG